MAENYFWQTPAVSGGVNNSLPDIAIADNEFSDSANYQPDLTGQGWIIKREGITKQDTTQRTGATTHSVYGGRNANYYHNGTVVYTFPSTPGAGTSRVTGMAELFDSWCSFGTYDIFVNGTDAQKSSNGTSFSALSNIPSGVKYVASSNNFIYAAGHDKGKLRYCSLGLAETWPAVNELVLTQDENDDIVGLLPVKNGVGVFCTKSFFIISGWSDLDQEVGYYDKAIGLASAPRSLVNTPYGIFFWSKTGIAWIKEAYAVDFPMVRKLAKTLAGLNRAQDANVHAVWDSMQQRLMVWLFNGASQTTCNLRADFYPATDSFFLHTGAGVAMSASGVATISGVENVYCGGYNPTYLDKITGNTDDGTAINSYLETKKEGNPLYERNGKGIIVTTDLNSAETVTYGAYQDYKTSLTRTVSLTPGTGGVDSYIALNLSNKRIKHRISDSGTTRTRILQLSHTGSANKVI